MLQFNCAIYLLNKHIAQVGSSSTVLSTCLKLTGCSNIGGGTVTQECAARCQETKQTIILSAWRLFTVLSIVQPNTPALTKPTYGALPK